MTDQMKDVNPDLLEAEGHEDIMRGHEKIARAKRMRHTVSADELLTADAVKARYHVEMRVVTDAARRGELVVEHVGRKPVVRVREIERWIASRPTRVKASGETASNTGVTSISKAVARLRRAS